MADITRYLSLITSEHSDKPHFRALLTDVLQKIDVAMDIDSAFDLDNAVGIQLDVLGLVMGLNRTLMFQPSGGTSSVLTDSDYRKLLKAKIVLNQWSGTMETLTLALNTWNSSINFSIKDNQDMSIDVVVVGTNTLQKELIENGYIVPKSAGVRINYAMSEDVIFAYDFDTGTLAGYNTGKWL
jgi:hypothetical protein